MFEPFSVAVDPILLVSGSYFLHLPLTPRSLSNLYDYLETLYRNIIPTYYTKILYPKITPKYYTEILSRNIIPEYFI